MKVTRFNLVELFRQNNPKDITFVVPLRPLRCVAGLICFTSSSDEPKLIRCLHNENRYKVEAGYKIELTPETEGNKGIFSSATFYQSDFEKILDDQQAFVYIRGIKVVKTTE